jgi:vacuolar-type H+-ATPase subunit I/STV1
MEIKIDLQNPSKIIAIGGALLFFLGAFLPLYGESKADFSNVLITLVLAIGYAIGSMLEKKKFSVSTSIAMMSFTAWIYFAILVAKDNAIEMMNNMFPGMEKLAQSAPNNPFSMGLAIGLEQNFSLSIGFALLAIGSLVSFIGAIMTKNIKN